MNRIIITAVGKDKVGIAAAICSTLANNNVNILDITQTIVDDFFNMMMIIDISHCLVSFVDLSDSMNKIGELKGVQIKCQREDIFDKMHRI